MDALAAAAAAASVAAGGFAQQDFGQRAACGTSGDDDQRAPAVEVGDQDVSAMDVYAASSGFEDAPPKVSNAPRMLVRTRLRQHITRWGGHALTAREPCLRMCAS